MTPGTPNVAEMVRGQNSKGRNMIADGGAEEAGRGYPLRRQGRVTRRSVRLNLPPPGNSSG